MQPLNPTVTQLLRTIILFPSAWMLLSSQGSHRETPTAADLIGKWHKDAGTTWEFRADNTYTMALGDGKTSVSGKYTLTAGQFTIADRSATGMASACPAEQRGVYKFTVKNRSLQATAASDPCPGRSSIAPGAYTRE